MKHLLSMPCFDGQEPSSPSGDSSPERRGFPVPSLKEMGFTPWDYILIVILLVLFTLCGSASVAGALLLSVPTAALYAAFCCRKGHRFSFALPVTGAILGLLVTFNGYAALGSLFAGMLARCLTSAVRDPQTRSAKTAAVTRCTLTHWGYLLLLLGLYCFFNPDFSLTGQVTAFFDGLEQIFLDQAAQLYNDPQFSQLLGQMYPGEALTPAAFDEMISYTVRQMRYLCPAVLTVVFLIFSYVEASLFRLLCKPLHAEEVFGGKRFEITLSSWALFCYFIASLGMLFARGTSYYCFRNLSYVLSPGFMLCGLKQIGAFFEKRGLPAPVLKLIQTACCGVAFVTGNLGVTVLILLGMLYTMNTERRKR